MSVNFSKIRRETIALELTPMIDIIFQLLIFFMLGSTFLYPAIELALPKSTSALGEPSVQEVILSIDKNGNYYINNSVVDYNSLKTKIADELSHAENKGIYFQADASLDYQKVLDAIRLAGEAGASKFNFIYEETESSTPSL